MRKIDNDIEFIYDGDFYSINKNQIEYKIIQYKFNDSNDISCNWCSIIICTSKKEIELLFKFDSTDIIYLNKLRRLNQDNPDFYLDELNKFRQKLRDECNTFYNKIFFNYIKS